VELAVDVYLGERALNEKDVVLVIVHDENLTLPVVHTLKSARFVPDIHDE